MTKKMHSLSPFICQKVNMSSKVPFQFQDSNKQVMGDNGAHMVFVLLIKENEKL